MAWTGAPQVGMPPLPFSQTSDLPTPTNLITEGARTQGGREAIAAGADTQKLMQQIMALLQHPLFKQLLAAHVQQAKPDKFNFHVPTGGVPTLQYRQPTPVQPRPTTRQGQ